MPEGGRIAYLCTTFPVASETFIQREVRALRELGADLEVWSLWGGQRDFEGTPVRLLPFAPTLPRVLLHRLPWAVARRAAALDEAWSLSNARPVPSALNLGETLWGWAAALSLADHFQRNRPALIHGIWATMPATTAWLLGSWLGIPGSMGAHAYDVFEDGGDSLLDQKVAQASWIHTSTEQTRQRLLRLGADPQKVTLIRRGLNHFPPCRPPRPQRATLRLLSVGRLVEKKGYRDLLERYAWLRQRGLSFEARIVGDGPLRPTLDSRLAHLGLSATVRLDGALGQNEVGEALDWADVFVFGGKVAPSGDRDGLPNVIPEAMAAGVPVVATPMEGVREAITDRQTGLLCQPGDGPGWWQALRSLQTDDALYDRLRRAARQWVECSFSARRNSAQWLERARAVMQSGRTKAGVPSGAGGG